MNTEPRDWAYKYATSQSAEAQRLRALARGPEGAERMPAPPFPEVSNPMLKQLVDRANEIAADDGPAAAIIWAVVHGWFEGYLQATK